MTNADANVKGQVEPVNNGVNVEALIAARDALINRNTADAIGLTLGNLVRP